jgi:hypothetical protein
MSPQLIDTSQTVGLSVATVTLSAWSLSWDTGIAAAAQILGIIALLASIALTLRKLYVSFVHKKKIDD